MVHKEKKVVEEMTPALLALKLAEKEEAERLKKQHAEDAKRKAEEDAEAALIEAEAGERAAQREADKLRRELEAKAAAEKAADPTFEQESVSLSALGFMTLKKKLVERGVPQADVNKAANKFALKEIASKYDCKITSSTEAMLAREMAGTRACPVYMANIRDDSAIHSPRARRAA